MAQAYSVVLEDLGVRHLVIGRGEESAQDFEAAISRPVRVGGLESVVAEGTVPSSAIVAVGVDHLAEVACTLLDAGVTNLLLEKPGGLDHKQLTTVREHADSATVTIAYNRRHYAATAAARRMINEDGGVTSFAFEVTEWPNATEPTQIPLSVRRRWFLAQSSHVVDLAFHLGGRAIDWSCWSSGSLPWHNEAARFSGAGITEIGATFGFHGDWEAPGRWGLEIMTRRRRLIFRPLETLQVMEIGSLDVSEVSIDDQLDRSFKPGIHEQTRAFLVGDNRFSCSLQQQLENVQIYEKMAGYR
jgi:hypothetical protein